MFEILCNHFSASHFSFLLVEPGKLFHVEHFSSGLFYIVPKVCLPQIFLFFLPACPAHLGLFSLDLLPVFVVGNFVFIEEATF